MSLSDVHERRDGWQPSQCPHHTHIIVSFSWEWSKRNDRSISIGCVVVVFIVVSSSNRKDLTLVCSIDSAIELWRKVAEKREIIFPFEDAIKSISMGSKRLDCEENPHDWRTDQLGIEKDASWHLQICVNKWHNSIQLTWSWLTGKMMNRKLISLTSADWFVDGKN